MATGTKAKAAASATPEDLVKQIEEQDFKPGVKAYKCPRCSYAASTQEATADHIFSRHSGAGNPNDATNGPAAVDAKRTGGDS